MSRFYGKIVLTNEIYVERMFIMAIFNNKNKDPDERADDLKFFTPSDAEYKIPASRKPVVVKKDKNAKKTSRVVKRAKPTSSVAKKTTKPKDDPKATAAKVTKVTKSEKTETKKVTKAATAPKPAAQKKSTPAKKATAPKKVDAAKADTKAKAKPQVTDEYVETVAEQKVSRVGSFDIKKAKDGRFVFNLYSANKVIIATSQVYSSSQSAVIGIKSVMANALKAQIEDLTLKTPDPKSYPKWEIYVDRAGEYRFRLNATNANCVCHAKAGYATKSNCKRAIESIIRLAESAEIDKSYIGEKK